MVNILNPMLMGPAQGLRQPPAMPAAVSAPSRFAALGDRAKSLLAPEVAWPMAAGMFMGRTPGESLGNAFMFGGQAMGEQKMKEEEQRQQNATLAYLQKSRPDLAAAVSAGMPMQMAWEHAFSKGPDLTDDMREYQMAADQGFGGSFMDYMTTMRKAGATNVTVGGGKYGTIPQGYELREGPNGASLAPIPGGPAAAEAEAAATAEQKRRQGEVQRGGIVTQEIDRALDVMEGGILPDTGFGGLLSGVPGTDAKALSARLETIKANIGFEELNKMRQQSPTGGALGQVTERELAFLQSVAGSLDQSQSAEDLRFNLNRLWNAYMDVIHGPGQGPERRPLGGNGASGGWQDRGNGVRIRKLD